MKVKDKLQGLNKFRNHLGLQINSEGASNKINSTLLEISEMGLIRDVKLVYYNDTCCVFTNLKHGKSVFNGSILEEKRPGALVRYRDCANPLNKSNIIDTVFNTERGIDIKNIHEDIMNIVTKNTEKRKILFLVRDPLQQLLSSIVQVGFQSGYHRDEGTLFKVALNELESISPVEVKILRKLITKGDARTMWRKNVDLELGSPAYNSFKTYFAFLLQNYSYLLLNDPHVYTLGNTAVRVTLNQYFSPESSNVHIVNLDNHSKRTTSFLEGFYFEHNITTPFKLTKDGHYRHSTYRLKPILLDAFKEIDINKFTGYYNILSRETHSLNELRASYNHFFR